MWRVGMLLMMMGRNMSSLVGWWSADATAVLVAAEEVRIPPGHTALGLGVDVAPRG